MLTRFNEDLIPSFELTREETQELEDTGFVITDDGICVTMLDNQDIRVWKEFEEYEGLKLNYGGRK